MCACVWHSVTVRESITTYQILCDRLANAHDRIIYITVMLLGGSDGVVNSLDFQLALLKSLGRFYFRCILSSQWRAVAVNLQFKVPTLKTFFKAQSQGVSGLFFHAFVTFRSAGKQCKNTFFPSSITCPKQFLQTQQQWHQYYFAILLPNPLLYTA